ncbi:F-box/kelch-repeat protein At3g23880-like [Lycium barbarum]|uniref:F-box/kelch-repeat protein At3g23880-like n=1 Tax=Lycium barbarum TaxID=112863 RepID=UPI00293EA3ED|nr:F-box/kelch-repeat protein At3g23880-like [Lycium barbarum]
MLAKTLEQQKLATLMEPEGDEAYHQQPKVFKPTINTQFPSTSSNKDSILTNPILPQELITAILVRLPVKYLLQYKCVSKDWFSLISSPYFVKTHLSFSAKNCTHHRFLLKCRHTVKHCSVSSLFNESSIKALELDCPMKSPYNYVCIVGSVNGLICLRVGFGGLVLWNPSTRKFKQVANLMSTRMYKFPVSGKYGFGYDEVHDDYKVVSIFFESKNRYIANIFSLKSDSWRTLDDFQGRVLYRSWGKLVNGKLHWLTGDDAWGIMSIDLVDEKCRKMEQPCYREENLILNLGVLGSDLSVICNYWRNFQISQVEVWIMKEYGVKESWTKLYTIKNPIDMLCQTLCMSNEGELLGVLGSTLMIYNSKDDLRRYPEVANIDSSLEAEHYVESLVSPMLENEQ